MVAAVDILGSPGSRDSRLYFLKRSYRLGEEPQIALRQERFGNMVLGVNRFVNDVGGNVVLYENERHCAGIGIEVHPGNLGYGSIADYLSIASTKMAVDRCTEEVLLGLPRRGHLGTDD